MNEIISMIIVGSIIVLPVALIALDIVFYVKKKERPFFELIAFFIGSIYMALGYGVWDAPNYTGSLNLYGSANVHEPFSTEHILSICVFMLCGFGSYFILKFARRALPPFLEVILLGGIYAGSVVNIVWIVQLICGANPEGMRMESFDYFEILCQSLVPCLFLIHVIQLLFTLVKEKAQKQEKLHYENPFMQKVNSWLLKGANLFWIAVLALLPILGILVILLCLFGQQPDSIILAFTQTSDWILSTEIAPPPVAYDTHYLCTVSLRGHRKLVRPIRYGIRKGEKIVVNRQLCVANAFEQLLMEKTPRFHRAVRKFYDTYGYPISRHINTAWSADIVYVIMKPLEWFFLLVLYLLDVKPENRIASQYLPKVQ